MNVRRVGKVGQETGKGGRVCRVSRSHSPETPVPASAWDLFEAAVPSQRREQSRGSRIRPLGATLQPSLQQPWWGCCKVLIPGLADFGGSAVLGQSGAARTRRYRFSVPSSELISTRDHVDGELENLDWSPGRRYAQEHRGGGDGLFVIPLDLITDVALYVAFVLSMGTLSLLLVLAHPSLRP